MLDVAPAGADRRRIVTGEGGSGGALALAVGDRVLMLENAYYSVISPEGCATILFKDAAAAPRAAAALRITAPDLLALRVMDAVVPEPEGGAHTDPAADRGQRQGGARGHAARAAAARARRAARAALRALPHVRRARAPAGASAHRGVCHERQPDDPDPNCSSRSGPRPATWSTGSRAAASSASAVAAGDCSIEIERAVPQAVAAPRRTAPSRCSRAARWPPGRDRAGHRARRARGRPAPSRRSTEADNRVPVLAPLVGHLLPVAPQPGAKPFVAEGDVVERRPDRLHRRGDEAHERGRRRRGRPRGRDPGQGRRARSSSSRCSCTSSRSPSRDPPCSTRS